MRSQLSPEELDLFTRVPASPEEQDNITRKIIALMNNTGLCAKPSLYQCLDIEEAARYGSWCRCSTCKRGPS